MKIVEIEYTPNPNAVKFILSESLTALGQHAEFKSPDEAENVPLAKNLMAIDSVLSVYWTDRWLTVTQDGSSNWHDLLREVAKPIRDATPDDAWLGSDFEQKMKDRADELEIEGMGLDDERIPLIQAIIDEEIMPFLQSDGGGLVLKAFVDNQLFIKYHGACGTCPSSTMGTLLAIENLIQMEVDPEISVVSVDAAIAPQPIGYW